MPDSTAPATENKSGGGLRDVSFHAHFSLEWQHGPLGTATLDDNADALMWAMRDLGYAASRYDGCDKGLVTGPRSVNFLFEAFNEKTAEFVLKNKQAGSRICCIVTEDPQEETWNGIKHGTPGDRMRDRMRWFKWLLERDAFCGLMYFVPHAGELLSKWHKNIAQVEVGWSEARESVIEAEFDKLGWVRGEPPPGIPDWQASIYEPQFNYGFFGGLLPRRQQLLNQIAKRTGQPIHMLSKGVEYDKWTGQPIVDHTRALNADYAPRPLRDREMTKAKILLGPAAFQKWGILSASRAMTCMVLRRAHVVEKTKPSIWHEILGDGYVDGFGQQFVDRAIKLLPAWKELAKEQRAACKELLPPEKTIGAAIQKLFPDVINAPIEKAA